MQEVFDPGMGLSPRQWRWCRSQLPKVFPRVFATGRERFAIPLPRKVMTHTDALPVLVQQADVGHGRGVASVGGLAIPLQGLAVVLRNAPPVLVQRAELVHGHGIAGVGGRMKQPRQSR
jgi:hypothetical protein